MYSYCKPFLNLLLDLTKNLKGYFWVKNRILNSVVIKFNNLYLLWNIPFKGEVYNFCIISGIKQNNNIDSVFPKPSYITHSLFWQIGHPAPNSEHSISLFRKSTYCTSGLKESILLDTMIHFTFNWVICAAPFQVSDRTKVKLLCGKTKDNQTCFSIPRVKGSKFSCIRVLLFRCCDVTLSLPNWPLPVLSSLSRNRKFPWCSSPSNHLFSISLSFFFFFSSVMKLPPLFRFLKSEKLIWPFPLNPQALLFPFPLSLCFLLSFYSSISLYLYLSLSSRRDSLLPSPHSLSFSRLRLWRIRPSWRRQHQRRRNRSLAERRNRDCGAES